jgi:hypothetical protein
MRPVLPGKPLEIRRYPGTCSDQDVSELQQFMNRLDKHPVAVENWDTYPEKPHVSFSISWKDQYLFLKFFVTESNVRGIFSHDYDPVYRDSCVEFFFSTEKNGPYYNIETNCIGTCLAEKGTSRHNRLLLPEHLISSIKRFPSLGNKPFEEKHELISWNLLLLIPVSQIAEIPDDLTKKILYVNLYKCGDDLSFPHYLSWRPIKTAQPDFHRPEFFFPMTFI